jgi:hypothetical protein
MESATIGDVRWTRSDCKPRGTSGRGPQEATANPRPRSAVEHALFAESDVLARGDDHTIEHIDHHCFPDPNQPGRDLDVIGARRGIARRVIVHQDQIGAWPSALATTTRIPQLSRAPSIHSLRPERRSPICKFSTIRLVLHAISLLAKAPNPQYPVADAMSDVHRPGGPSTGRSRPERMYAEESWSPATQP